MYRLKKYLSLIFLISFFSNGQTPVDSLTTLLNNTEKSSARRVDLLNELGYEYWIINSKQSLLYGNEALALAKKLNYTAGEAKARRVTGVACWTLGNYKNALLHLNQSEKLYTVLHNEEGVANCQLNTGMVYADIKEYDTALQLYHKAIEKFSKLGLKSRIATAYTKIGTVMIEKQHYFDAGEYLTNALTIHSEHEFTYGIAEAHNRLGRLYIAEENFAQADYHLRRAIVLSKKVNDQDGIISNLILYGKLLRLKEEFEAAEAHLDIGLEKAREKGLQKYSLEALKELVLLKKVTGKTTEALNLFEDYEKVKDSVYNVESTNQIAALRYQNELAAKNSRIKHLKESELKNKLIRNILAVALIIISILSFFLIRSHRQKYTTQKQLLQATKITTRTEAENENLKQEELKRELERKNRELTSYTLNFVQNNELFNELEEKIKLLKNDTAEKQNRQIAEIEKIIAQYSSNKGWDDFKVYFEEVHPDFFTKLKKQYPALSSNDLKIAALTRLNLNIKETANIVGISPDSIKTARYRLRKKLGLSPEEDLLAFLIDTESNNV